MSAMLPILILAIFSPIFYPLVMSEKLFVGYVFLAFIPAMYLAWTQNGKRWDTAKIKEACFPRAIWSHPSTKVDIRFFIINTIFFMSLVVPFISGNAYAAHFTRSLLTDLFGPMGAPLPVTLAGIFIVTLLLALVTDFAIFFVHYIQHKIPFLWEFHKVHHSAEVLTPLTVYRKHPVDDIPSALLVGLLSGIVVGCVNYLFIKDPGIIRVAGLDLFTFLFYIAFYNLRHSHIWLHYPGAWGKIFVSPAMHQIHHSSIERHWDKNFGFIFGFWDWMFGCLYLPKEKEELVLGIGPQTPDYNSVRALYVLPFIRGFRLLRRKRLLRPRMALLLLPLLAGSAPHAHAAGVYTPPSLFLDELTWPEVKQAMDAGYRRILIPTAGTEENGPHLILAKHYYIVKYTAQHTAQKLGHTLIAPVIAYVPEASHMDFPGTISLSPRSFYHLMYDTADSLRAHGFNAIYMMGDSYDNQAPQDKLAGDMQKDWASEGVILANLRNYYAQNGQVDWLQKQGYTMEQIGGHAGIRETSEMLVAYPQGVRMDKIRDYKIGDGSGANGNATAATAHIGQILLDLKIDTAAREISAIETRYKEKPAEKPGFLEVIKIRIKSVLYKIQ